MVCLLYRQALLTGKIPSSMASNANAGSLATAREHNAKLNRARRGRHEIAGFVPSEQSVSARSQTARIGLSRSLVRLF
jgi:hypothetical protein